MLLYNITSLAFLTLFTILLVSYSDVLPVAVLKIEGRGTSAESRIAETAFLDMTRRLDRIGIKWTVSDLGIPSILVVPYGRDIDRKGLELIKFNIARGGKVIVFFGNDRIIANLLGFTDPQYLLRKVPHEWSYIKSEGKIIGFPHEITLPSRQVSYVYPDDKGSFIGAFWMNSYREKSNLPAITVSDRGIWCSFLLRDELNTVQSDTLLLSLLAYYRPDLWEKVTLTVYTKISEKVSKILKEVESIDEIDKRKLLSKVDRIRILIDNKSFIEAYEELMKLNAMANRIEISHKFYLRFKRIGIWEHFPEGPLPGRWDEVCRRLKFAGITDIYLNVIGPGYAFYNSKFINRSSALCDGHDPVKECIEASHRYGIRVNAWVILWNIESATEEFVERMQREDRLLKNDNGSCIRWLSPQDPRNINFFVDILKEIFLLYDFDGAHFDYMRYPEKAYLTESEIEKRKMAISSAIKEIAGNMRRIKQGCEISVAVYGDISVALKLGQDYGRWITEGIVDYVCPMNYVEDTKKMSSLLERQLHYETTGKIMPGIGITPNNIRLDIVTTFKFFEKCYQYNFTGIVLFELIWYTLEILPFLKPVNIPFNIFVTF